MRMLEVQNPENIHNYAGCVKFFNHLDFNFFFVEAPENSFYANKYILRYSSFKYIYICH